MSSKALAVQDATALIPSHPTTKVDDLRVTFENLRKQRVNLVSPVSSIDSIPGMCGVSLRAVMVDPSVGPKGNGPEVYKGGFCADNERALGKVALEKIMAAAGVQVLGKLRLDDRSEPFYCEMEFTLGVRDLDGLWRQVTKSKAIDLRDGGADYQKIKAQNNAETNLREARSNILSNCETKAQLRALRTVLHLKQKYTLEELAQPFVVPKLVPALDPSDPDQKAAMISMAIGSERQLYPAARQAPGDFTRALPESAAPPPALPSAQAARPPQPPPPVGAPTEIDEDEEAPDASDFELPDLTPPPAKAVDAMPVVCTCPCGCQGMLTPAVADMTTKQVGVPRCSDCYPNQRFNFAKHLDVTVPLGIKTAPTLTVDGLRSALARARAAAK